MRAPVMSEPVNAILATLGWSTSGEPASAPKPVTTFTTPGGMPARATILANSSVEAEGYSDGLITAVLPAARHGASFHASSRSGEFHGTIRPHTPSGSQRV